jgi:hypothetical protein
MRLENAHLMVAALAMVGMAACTTTPSGTGPDRSSRSDVSQVQWSDGQPAYAITCEDPGGCQRRALALCRNGQYTTLKEENMPSIGTRREPLGSPSVVIRCS